MLDYIRAAGLDTIGVGKIYDIFDGEGVSEKLKTTGNANGMEVTLELAQRVVFRGLAFVNLVDFDMVYGHRNDVNGYANAATEFDGQLAKLLPLLRAEDLLIITADHGCDPATHLPIIRVVCADARLWQRCPCGRGPGYKAQLLLALRRPFAVSGRACSVGREKASLKEILR